MRNTLDQLVFRFVNKERVFSVREVVALLRLCFERPSDDIILV